MEKHICTILRCGTAALVTFGASRLRTKFRNKAIRTRAAKTIQRIWRSRRAHEEWRKTRLDAILVIQRQMRRLQASIRKKDEEEIREANMIGAARCRAIEPKDIIVHQSIGQGAFGQIWMGQEEGSGRLVAIKKLSKRRHGAQSSATNEVRLLQEVATEPFCLAFYGAFQTTQNAFIVTEFVGGGDLMGVLQEYQQFPEEAVKFYCANIVMALEYIHSQNIIHRDLKPDNLLVAEDGYLVLADFGLAKQTITRRAYSLCGTREYMAPEYHVSNDGLTPAVDYWALGVILFMMLTHRMPFDGDRRKQLKGDYLRPAGISDEAADFISQLFKVDPNERLTFNALNHPWFVGLDLEGIRDRSAESPVDPDVAGVSGMGMRLVGLARAGAAASSGGPSRRGQVWNESVWQQLDAAF